jgi:hypothetical protein
MPSFRFKTAKKIAQDWFRRDKYRSLYRPDGIYDLLRRGCRWSRRCRDDRKRLA